MAGGSQKNARPSRSTLPQESRQHRAVPDGIVAHRNAVRKKGGLMAVASALVVLTIGLLMLALPGSLSGLVGFVLTFVALPTLPLFGVPASGGLTIYSLGFLSSMALWFVIGHYASLRALRAVIASWPEWRSEFGPLAIGLALGSLISLGLAGLILGVL